jgi:formylglycine-generating enzyme required for sulfatase activity
MMIQDDIDMNHLCVEFFDRECLTKANHFCISFQYIMKTITTASLFLAALHVPAFAIVAIDYVTVGNAGNAADPSTGLGAVGYEYQIGKHEVTNAQYAEFLNAKAATDNYSLYHVMMPSLNLGISRNGSSGSYTYSVTSELANRPVALVSWFDAARFTNWLSNGQGSGDTETGSYTLNGAMSGIILKNAGAQFYIPTENEWYKAAYYNGITSSYSLYPNGQNSITTADANFAQAVGESTDVGSYSGDPSFYGTFDQGGNVAEWNDATKPFNLRGMRGGAWSNTPNDDYLASTPTASLDSSPSNEGYAVGFRVASSVAAIPEPGTALLGVLGLFSFLRRKRC